MNSQDDTIKSALSCHRSVTQGRQKKKIWRWHASDVAVTVAALLLGRFGYVSCIDAYWDEDLEISK